MIYVLLTRGFRDPVRTFLRGRGRKLRRRLRFIVYEDAIRKRPRTGVWIFADIERLDATQRAQAVKLHEDLAPQIRLTHPGRAMRRTELLAALSERGINRFEAHPADGTPNRWPVFLRGRNDHLGSTTPLLDDEHALRGAIESAPDLRELLMIEYVDTRGADGLFRKYSAFRIGDRIVPRHLFFGRDWMLKNADHVDEPTVAEEMEYIRTNPHENEIRTVFDLANIEYGRIDYAFLDGTMQVWEINTNPMIMSDVSFEHAGRSRVQEAVLPHLIDAFRALEPRTMWWSG